MTYEAWRISFQSSEQAARAAWIEWHKAVTTPPQPCPRCAELEQDLQTNADALAEVEQIRLGLQNCRLFAARHRNEDCALLILGFCAEAGEVGSITR